MEGALSLLLLLNFLLSSYARVSVTVTPRRSQFFKYEKFSVSCKDEEEQDSPGWTVMKEMEDGELRKCPSPCTITAAFPLTDSGVYWCETELGETSDSVNITISAGNVILESPVHPVTEGVPVILTCRCDLTTSCPAGFYKDDVLIGTSAMGSVLLHSVSRSDEGLYRCKVDGRGESPHSWLIVKAPPADQDAEVQPQFAFVLIRRLVVALPYVVCTILLRLIYRDRARDRRRSEAWQTSNYVQMEIIAINQ